VTFDMKRWVLTIPTYNCCSCIKPSYCFHLSGDQLNPNSSEAQPPKSSCYYLCYLASLSDSEQRWSTALPHSCLECYW